MTTKIAVFPEALTEAICDVLAQTDWPGLTNTEIDRLLNVVKIGQRENGANKRDSLLRTLHNRQVRQEAGNALSAFVRHALDPTRYTKDPARREHLIDGLEEPLLLHGWCVNEDGRMKRGRRARTLSEAAEMARGLRAELRRRKVHDELLRYCSDELVAKSLFHAMSEAAKSIPDRMRTMTGSGLDGADLYNSVLGMKAMTPKLRISELTDDSDIGEQRGFINLLLGVHGHYRNPRAHRTRLGSDENRQDLLDAFGLFSYVHRRLDGASFGPP